MADTFMMIVIHGEDRYGEYLDAGTGLNEACLSLLEVDDVPDGVEVLKKKKHCIRYALE